jgi:hypothetical protein
MPKNGTPCVRAYSAAFIMPRVPRDPKPPGTRMPWASSSSRGAAFLFERLGLDPVQSTFTLLAKPAVEHRFVQALVEILVAGVYLPTTWMVSSSFGFLMRWTELLPTPAVARLRLGR